MKCDLCGIHLGNVTMDIFDARRVRVICESCWKNHVMRSAR